MIQSFDPDSGRYVITMTAGGPAKRIRPENVELLQMDEINDDPVSEEGRFHHGARVQIFGLMGAKFLNGKVGTIRHFDFGTHRYVVEIPGQPPKRIKPENLQPAGAHVRSRPPHRQSLVEQGQSTMDQAKTNQALRAGGANSVCQGSAHNVGPNGWSAGTKVRLHGLRSPVARPWNGLVAVVHCFDDSTGRYVVALPDGTPRKIKANNLQSTEGSAPEPQIIRNLQDGPGGDDSGGGQQGQQGQASICKAQAANKGFVGPGGLKIGMKVTLHGLKSAAAQRGHLNGMVGVVHCYDTSSQRYVVACPDKVPRKFKPANLMAPGGQRGAGGPPGAASICQHQATKGLPGGLSMGSKVRLHGLKSPAAMQGRWNGMTGVVHCYVPSAQRYVVACSDGSPRKLKLANLQNLGASMPQVRGRRSAAPIPDQPDSEGAPEPAHRGGPKSICGGHSAANPGGLAIGTKVAIFGLTSKAAMNGRWNGMVGVVHCYDSKSLRYVCAMSDGHPRKIKVENLAIVTTAKTQTAQAPAIGLAATATAPKKVQWLHGAYVRIAGLKQAAELNGLVGSVVGFENTTERYVIKIQGVKRLKRIHVKNLVDVAASEPVAAPIVAAVAGVDGAPAAPATPSAPHLSVCNAYATRAPMQVFAVSSDGKHYTHVVKSLDFQECQDVDNLPAGQVGSFAFILGKFQVAKKVIDFSSLTQGQGLELVVSRKDINSLQADVHENPVEIGDKEAYYLHIVNAYAGRKSLELHVQRGKFMQKLPLGKTFRLSTIKPLKMVLSDGTQKLKLAFQPQHAKTYCIMTTGVDAGLKGEPRNVGLLAHEIGAWTSSEEMANEDVNNEQPAAKGDGEEEEGAQEEIAAPKPKLGLVSVIGGLFGGGR